MFLLRRPIERSSRSTFHSSLVTALNIDEQARNWGAQMGAAHLEIFFAPLKIMLGIV